MFLPAAGPGDQLASCVTTCSGGAAVAGFPGWAAGRTEAGALPRGQEAPASFERRGAGKAAPEGQPEASVVREAGLALSVLPQVCSGFQVSVSQRTPERGSGGR